VEGRRKGRGKEGKAKLTGGEGKSRGEGKRRVGEWTKRQSGKGKDVSLNKSCGL